MRDALAKTSNFPGVTGRITLDANRNALVPVYMLRIANEYAERHAGGLALNGPKRLVEIARAMASKPKLLLLDEPTSGMNATETVEVSRQIRAIRDGGVTKSCSSSTTCRLSPISRMSSRCRFSGAKIAEGTSEDILKEPAVIEAYLGSDDLP